MEVLPALRFLGVTLSSVHASNESAVRPCAASRIIPKAVVGQEADLD